MSDETLLTVEQVAERLQVHVETVRRWLRAGVLEGTFLGRRAGYRISEKELRDFLLRGKKEAA